MRDKWLIFRLAFAVLILLATDCTPRPATVTPQPAVQGVEITPANTYTPTPDVKAQEREALQALLKKCAAVQPGYACLVQGPVEVEAQPDRKLKSFKTAGDMISLDDLQRLKVGSPGSTDGVVWLSIPGDTPGAVFTVMAFGDVELTNAVPFGSTEFSAMQVLWFTTGAAEDYDQALTRGLMVDAPHNGPLNTLVINGVEMVFGSTALITGRGGFSSVNTIAGAVGLNLPDRAPVVVQGTHYIFPDEPGPAALTDEQYDALQREYGIDYRNDITPEKVPEERYRAIVEEANRLLWRERQREQWGQHELPPELTDEQWDALERKYGKDYRNELARDKVTEERYRKLGEEANEILREEQVKKELERKKEEAKRMKNWQGGWWKMTYGPYTISGSCLQEAVGDGAGGGDGEPYSVEVPICRGNKGRTILMYDSGETFNRAGPNLYVSGRMEEMLDWGSKEYVNSGRYDSLQVLSPTRMKMNIVSSEAGGCTMTHTAYLDFLRDDPAIRCSKIIEIDPDETPEPEPTPEPTQPPLPPKEGDYTVRLAYIPKACDAQAKEALPDFLTAQGGNIRLSPAPDGGLAFEAHSGSYLLALGPAFNYWSDRDNTRGSKQGMYSLEQPLDDIYQLSMTLMQVSEEQFGGTWHFFSQDGEQYCSGSIDLLAEK